MRPSILSVPRKGPRRLFLHIGGTRDTRRRRPPSIKETVNAAFPLMRDQWRQQGPKWYLYLGAYLGQFSCTNVKPAARQHLCPDPELNVV